MSTEISEQLAVAAAAVGQLVAGVRDDQLEQATPCADYTVRDLLGHLLQVVENFQVLARRGTVDWTTAADRVTGDWRAGFAAETAKLTAAWSDPATLEGVSPGMGLPQRTVGQMILGDLVVHGWDLARATGQPYQVPPSLVPAVREFLDTMVETGRTMGAFGDPVEPPPDADEVAELLALTGRDPAWSAG
ncbi:TIGR03086 family metal-binding protein [Actinoplanes oblitus]|uniref:TIGR03086 family metal-binding protein n=1 Tax=Actinoplanes oblitus TaxID=3040509 RepID=A0ABY8W418_9ACTN|nr:TIGR03086 family metal-binding protein [Actinoplanes oblitus]WIM92614.1 TIGR03086 family metal-binding protein [Actinoplanes oblitus]